MEINEQDALFLSNRQLVATMLLSLAPIIEVGEKDQAEKAFVLLHEYNASDCLEKMSQEEAKAWFIRCSSLSVDFLNNAKTCPKCGGFYCGKPRNRRQDTHESRTVH